MNVVGKIQRTLTMRKRIVIVAGTRPEAIKLSPLILELHRANWAEPVVVATGQHGDLLSVAMGAFGIRVDHDLALMTPAQSLAGLTSRAFQRLDACLHELAPDMVIAQGDTTSVMAAGVCSFYRRIPFGHVEAGLRTNNLHAPFPEEFNRRVAGLVADLHFAPTEIARQNLLREDVPNEQIHVVGNTVIDALHAMLGRKPAMPFAIGEDACVLLLTAHRRESFGEPMRQLFGAVAELVRRYPKVEVIYPVHPNPAVSDLASEMLGSIDRVHLCAPLAYPQLVSVMARCHLVLTDSGGLQEEAPALGKPVLVLRETTERPEAVELGVARLVGTDRSRVVEEVARLLDDPAAYRQMARGVSPYGDGKASARITSILECYFEGRRVGPEQALRPMMLETS